MVSSNEPSSDAATGIVGSGLKGSRGHAEMTSVEYSRRLYDDVLGWYHSADAKAQVILGLDGAFLAFVAAAAFQKPIDLIGLTAKFSPWTWRSLDLMAATLALSITSAIYCLWSRVYFRPSVVVDRIRAKSEGENSTEYPPGVMWFFQFISVLDPPVFRKTLVGVNASFEIEVLASQIIALADNVRKKHLAANLGFAFAVVTLFLFAAAAVSYVIAVASAD
jgi:hypothetical protein